MPTLLGMAVRTGTLGVVAALLTGALLCGACGADGQAGRDEPSPVAASSTVPDPTRSPSQTPTESPTPEPLTPEQQWTVHYTEDESAYVAAVAAALALKPRRVQGLSGALRSCALLAAEKKLDRRTGVLAAAFGLPAAPSYAQAVAVLDATVTTVCPEFTSFHEAQTAQRAEELEAEARRQRRAARKERQKAREKARQEAAAQEAAEQAAQHVHYANCSAVEAAGAAPIHVGDPGYSRDLDRDGDGVACEQ